MIYDRVGSVKPSDVSFDNVLAPLLEVDRDSYTRGVTLQVQTGVSDKNS